MALINLVFSIPSPRFTEEQQAAFSRFGQWVILNELGANLLIDAVGPEENLQAALDALASMGRSATIIGEWGHNGNSRRAVNVAQWIATAPDEVDPNSPDPENPSYRRPTTFKQIHKWQGWGDKQI